MKLLLCKDFGIDCPTEFRGETFEDVLEQAKKHGKEAHHQTDEQVHSEKVIRIASEKTQDI